MKKSILSTVGVVTSILVAVLVRQLFFSTTFDKELMKVAGEMNKSCPIMVDSETRLDNTMALPENVLRYNYTLINMTSDMIDVENLKSNLEPMILNQVKTNPDLKLFRDHRTTMSYSYKDKEGRFILQIDITPDKYD